MAHQNSRRVLRPKRIQGAPKLKSIPIRFSKAEIKLITAAARTLDPGGSKEQ